MASYRHVSSPVCNFNLTEFKNNDSDLFDNILNRSSILK